MDPAASLPTTLLLHGAGAPPPGLADWRAGLQIGPFILKHCLGSGGMGVVWLAEQVTPLRRQVALKVLAGADRSPMAQALFELERQALARLSHRAIAQIHDAGRLPDGNLFFAMEYVPGVPLHQFVQDQRPDLRKLVGLLIELCQAVQHAHQRNLIHRDIKPGNVLVQLVDGVPLPRLIDFGIAMSSQAGSSFQGGDGTPGYMAPEQLEPGAAGIDQRVDVYGIGAVLAECLCLLAGLDPPLGGFDSVHAHQVLHLTLGDARASGIAGEDRREGLDAMRRQPVELRAIARKALVPDREHRYGTADAMAQDLRRWLECWPVLALPSTRRYRLRCFLRRHALASAALAGVLLAVVIGLGLALYGLREAQTQRSVAESARQLAERRREDAERLIQFMLGDLAERLRPLGRLDLLDEVGKEAMAYVGRQEAPADARAALHQAQALRTLAGVQLAREQDAAAGATLAQAAALLAPWQRDSRDPELHKVAGEIAFRQGRLAFVARQFDAAAAFWEANLQHALVLAQVGTDPAASRKSLANALNNLAVLELEGRHHWASASAHLESVIGLLSTRDPAAAPGDAALLANAWAWKALAQMEQGQSGAAWVSLHQALAVLQQQPSGSVNSLHQLVEFEVQAQIAQHAADLGLAADAATAVERAYQLAASQAGLEEADNPKSRRRLARIVFQAAILPDGTRPAEFEQRLARAHTCLAAPDCLGTELARRNELQALAALARLSLGGRVADEPALATIVDAGLADAEPSVTRLRVLVRLGQYLPLTEIRRTRTIDAVDRIEPELRTSLRYDLLQFEMLSWLEPHSGALKALAARIGSRRRAVRDQPSD